jgi:hypothetical protein
MKENKKQNIELGDIFRENAKGYMRHYQPCPVQQKALMAIINCRTATMGGHLQRCNNCPYARQAYNSCRNRHCPKCQFVKKAQWVDKLAGNLPATKHFHLVFTIPQCLHKLFYINQKTAYGLLFKAAGRALQQCARNPKYLGAKAGAVGILHTWGQTLTYHPHVHMIVPAGGLSEDGTEWIPSSRKFFLPVKVLSTVFRGILCKLLGEALAKGYIILPDDTGCFNDLRKLCYKNHWVVYAEKPFSCPDNLIRYLGNYTHRVAITNHRLIGYGKGKVVFQYKDYKSGGIRRKIALDTHEFMRRFMQHVLPSGFSKIRYFGFLALQSLKSSITQCGQAIGKTTDLPQLEGLSGYEVFRQITGKDPVCCPQCKAGKLIAVKTTETDSSGPG